MNDPELKAMASVYDALQSLDADTRKRVTDWVLSKLAGGSSAGAKRGRKPGTKKAKGAKRGRKPGAVTAAAPKKAGKRGRPAGSTNKKVKPAARKKPTKGRGRPRKTAVAESA